MVKQNKKIVKTGKSSLSNSNKAGSSNVLFTGKKAVVKAAPISALEKVVTARDTPMPKPIPVSKALKVIPAKSKDITVKPKVEIKAPVTKIPVIAEARQSDNPVVNSNVKKMIPQKMVSTTKQPIEADNIIKNKVQKKKLFEVSNEHQNYFVYLKNPLEYRRHLLESSRKILFCLKSHQKIVLIRQRKLEEMKKLKASVRELIFLNKQFNDKLPKYHTGFLDDVPSKDKVSSANTKSKEALKPAVANQDKTEMDRLEESLANIEKKLKSLQ